MALRTTPARAVIRGALAGLAGTAAMTAWQELSAQLRGGSEPEPPPEDPWEAAPAPAQVARRVLEGVLHQPVSAEQIPLLTNVMHWGYGTAWGAVYGIVAGGAKRRKPLRRGVKFGQFVWAMSYVQLVPMGLYQPPWEYEPDELAMDLSYHVAYGLGTGVAHVLLGGA